MRVDQSPVEYYIKILYEKRLVEPMSGKGFYGVCRKKRSLLSSQKQRARSYGVFRRLAENLSQRSNGYRERNPEEAPRQYEKRYRQDRPSQDESPAEPEESKRSCEEIQPSPRGAERSFRSVKRNSGRVNMKARQSRRKPAESRRWGEVVVMRSI